MRDLLNFNIMDKNKPSQLIPDEINTHLQIFGRVMGYEL